MFGIAEYFYQWIVIFYDYVCTPSFFFFFIQNIKIPSKNSLYIPNASLSKFDVAFDDFTSCECLSIRYEAIDVCVCVT